MLIYKQEPLMMHVLRRKILLFFFISITGLFSPALLKAGVPFPGEKASATIKILTIGNSFSDNAITYLPEIVGSVPGYSVDIARASLGGCSLERHASLMAASEEDPDHKPYQNQYSLQDLLQMEDYDFVTIQQVSSLSFKPETFHPHAGELIRLIEEYQPDAEIVIHQTWAYPNAGRLKDWNISYDEMYEGLVNSYDLLSKQYDLSIMPVGSAFYLTHQKNDRIDLWSDDRHHANVNGCYLAGCVWFGKLFHLSPNKIRFVPDGMDEKTARTLRKMAAKEISKYKDR